MFDPEASTHVPNLDLLDLNLPGTDGTRSLAKKLSEMKILKRFPSRDFDDIKATQGHEACIRWALIAIWLSDGFRSAKARVHP